MAELGVEEGGVRIAVEGCVSPVGLSMAFVPF